MCFLIRDVVVVKCPFPLTWPLKQVWKGDMLFSSEVRSRSEEHNCRLALILQAGSQSKQLGRNAGGKAEKGRPGGGGTAGIHLHARGSSGSSGCTKGQMKLLGHGSDCAHTRAHSHTHSLKCITLHSDGNHRGSKCDKKDFE